MQPLNALDRYVTTGGAIPPFVGYKFFDDKDLQFNLGLKASRSSSAAAPPPVTVACAVRMKDTFAIGYLAGPRISLPVGPIEIYGNFLGGGMTGVGRPSAISDTSGGFQTGGGINYNINETSASACLRNWTRQYQRVHGVGDVRFVTTGIELLVQESPPAPPAPVAQVPPPPPRAADEEEDRPARRELRLRQV